MTLNLTAAGAEWGAGERSWTSTDTILYALGVGARSADPLREPEFTTENSHGVDQKVLPTFAVTIGGNDGGQPRLGDFDLAQLPHAEQSVTPHRELPPSGTSRTTTRLAGFYDKGADALIVLESASIDATTGERRSGEPSTPPSHPADHVVTCPTRADQALLHRLSGDRNPLHSESGTTVGCSCSRRGWATGSFSTGGLTRTN
ncbi:hypothetical protein [Streptomyces sp. NPDC002276]